MSYAKKVRMGWVLAALSGLCLAGVMGSMSCGPAYAADGAASTADTPDAGKPKVLASTAKAAASPAAGAAAAKASPKAEAREIPRPPEGVKQIMLPAEAMPAADAAAVGSGPNASDLQQEISLDLRDMDIIDVLKFLSLKGKFNLAISKTVAGRVTLAMKRVTIKNALDIILKANGLASYWMDNIIYVMPAEEYFNTYGKKFDDKTTVKIFNLRYAKPSYVLATLDSIKSNIGKIIIDEDTGSVVLIDTDDNLKKMVEVLTQMDTGIATTTYKLQYAAAKDIAAQLKLRLDAKSVGSIQADDRSNQVMVSALPERLKEIEKLIKELDAPTKAVLIEVRILSITLNPQYNAGINWSNPFGQSQGAFSKINVLQAFPIASTVSSLGTLGSVTYGAANPNMLQLNLQMLQQVLDTRTIARPRLMVTNNEEANIHIGDTIPYVTSTTTGTGDTATVSEQINFIDVGIKLKVKPTINDDGIVTMKIRPEISSRTKDVLTPKGAAIPQVNTTFVETTAIVKDGYTVIIGGLKQLVNSDNRAGLPGLMNAPVVGDAFKNVAKSVTDTEICIFLTPHIVTGSQNVTDQKKEILPDKDYEITGTGPDDAAVKEAQDFVADKQEENVRKDQGKTNIKPKRKLKQNE